MKQNIFRIFFISLLALLYSVKLIAPFPLADSSYKAMWLLVFVLSPIIVWQILKFKLYKHISSTDVSILLFLSTVSIGASVSEFPSKTFGWLSHTFIAILAYYLTFVLSQKDHRLVKITIVAVSIFNIISSFLALLTVALPSFTEIHIWKRLLWDNVFEKFSSDLEKNRIRPIGATVVTSFLPIYLISKKNSGLKIIGFVGLFCGMINILLFNYRNYILIFFIFTILFLTYLRNNYTDRHLNSNIALLSFSPAVFLLIALIVGLATRINPLARFIDKNDLISEAISTRVNQAKISINIFRLHPILGIGIGTYPQYAIPIKTTINSNSFSGQKNTVDFKTLGPHNIIFQTLTETGLVGFIAFSCMLIVFAKEDFTVVNILGLNGLLLSSVFWIYLSGSMLDAFPPYAFSISMVFRGLTRSLLLRANNR